MTAGANSAAETFALALGDDELVTGHRLSWWVARAPTIEEDNALSSIVQDELGHARLWFEVVADRGEASLVDLAIGRPTDQRRNSVLVEPPYEDFGETVVRNLVYNLAEQRLLESVRDGDDDEFASRAAVVLEEEPYHREHATAWLDRLVATDEGRTRLRRAFERTLPAARDYFAFDGALEAALLEAGVLADPLADLRGEWADRVAGHVRGVPVDLGVDPAAVLREAPATNGRLGEHTDDLDAMVREGLTTY